MNVVYLFYNGESVFIPMIGYNPALFMQLKGFGRWNWQQKQFFLPNNLDAAQYRNIFGGLPYIEVKQDGLISVNGFFGRSWDGWPPDLLLPSSRINEADRSCIYSRISLPEMFSPFWVEKLKAELHSRKYSPKTINSYLYYNRDFCRTIQKQAEDATEADFTTYLAGLDAVKMLSSSSMNLAISAIRFFYCNVMGKNFGSGQYRPRHDKRLPSVLSREEIERLLDTEPNPKHRLLLMLAYSSGLRVSELIALKMEHIDISRRTLLVYGAKGRKDRVTILADRAAAFLDEYCRRFNITNWLFPGQDGGPLNIRTAQNIFEKAARNAHIHKKVSIHSLRHTFATHLFESGTDIRYIQTLLGHSNLKTTSRYTHIAKRNILSIKSPLDIVPIADYLGETVRKTGFTSKSMVEMDPFG